MSEQGILDWGRYCELFLFFQFIHTTAMDKVQVEEMCDLFSQKITYEEIGAILQAIYPSARGYSVKSTKRFWKRMEFLPGFFKTVREQ